LFNVARNPVTKRHGAKRYADNQAGSTGRMACVQTDREVGWPYSCRKHLLFMADWPTLPTVSVSNRESHAPHHFLLCPCPWSFSPAAAAFAQDAACDDGSSDHELHVTLCESVAVKAIYPEAAAVALGYKGEALRFLGRYDEATETLHRALDLSPRNVANWIELGGVAYLSGDPAGAVAHYTMALQFDPGNAYALLLRAGAWDSLNAPDLCLADTSVVLEADGSNFFANSIHGKCLVSAGRADDGLRYIDFALVIDQADLHMNLSRMVALMALGRDAEAVAEAESALSRAAEPDEEDVTAITILRVAAMMRADPAADVSARIDALGTTYPDNLDVDRLRVKALLQAGLLPEAEAAAARLTAISGTAEMTGEYHDILGALFLAKGRKGLALFNFGRAMALDATLAQSYARRVSALGFPSESAKPADLLKQLDRCITAIETQCQVGF